MSKNNPFGWGKAGGPSEAAALFEEAKRWRAEQEKIRDAAMREQALMQAGLAQQLAQAEQLARAQQLQVGSGARPFPAPPLGLSDLRAAFLAGPQQPPEAASGFEVSRAVNRRAQEAFEEARRQLAEVQARQDRVASAMGSPADAAAEAARQDLGRALNRAVETGLVTEDRAVAMIVAGGINNAPLGPADARAQVVAALAQAVAADVLSRAAGNRIAAILDPETTRAQGDSRPRLPADGPPDESPDDPDLVALRELALASAPASGAAVSEADLARLVSSVPGLIERIAAVEDALYEALTIRPCHRADHDERHRDSSEPCEFQARATSDSLIGRLGLPPRVLPRSPHREPDGRRAACCARDGRIGTWLVYGQTLDPSATFGGDRGPPADPPSQLS